MSGQRTKALRKLFVSGDPKYAHLDTFRQAKKLWKQEASAKCRE